VRYRSGMCVIWVVQAVSTVVRCRASAGAGRSAAPVAQSVAATSGLEYLDEGDTPEVVDIACRHGGGVDQVATGS